MREGIHVFVGLCLIDQTFISAPLHFGEPAEVVSLGKV